MKKIFVAIPTIGLIHHDSAHSLMELICDLTRMEAEGYKYILGVMPRMLVAQARELAVEKALEVNCDYLFFVDDDMVLPRNIVKRLLSHKKDIVGAMSFERMGDHSPNIYTLYSYQKGKNAEGQKTGSMRWANILDYANRRDKEGLLEVDVIGFGCVLLDMRIFKGKNKIEPTWFMSQFQVGEDFFFCWKAKQHKYKIYADCHPDWQVGHIGDNPVITEDLFHLKLKLKYEKEKSLAGQCSNNNTDIQPA